MGGLSLGVWIRLASCVFSPSLLFLLFVSRLSLFVIDDG